MNSRKKITVLGAGLVGQAIVTDLAARFQVTAVDCDPKRLERLQNLSDVIPQQADLSKPGILEHIIGDADLVVGALPGYMGFGIVRDVIRAGKNMVDISFFPQDPFPLNKPAEEAGVSVVMDCGVAPGMGNIILGYHQAQMQVERYECLVGGLPFKREWPYQYKAVFSPVDVIEEYVRPARYVENGHLVVKEALSDPELVEFDEVGTLEAWNSDGLRTLIHTMKIPHMIEKTLRYPGTIEYLKVLRKSGFFSAEEVDVGGKRIRPVDLSARLLARLWEMKPGEEDFTVMRIRISGYENGKEVQYIYHLFDRFDRETGTISMARTTGYTCTAAASLLLEGKYTQKGLSPPEYLGKEPQHFQYIINYLKERGVVCRVEKHEL